MDYIYEPQEDSYLLLSQVKRFVKKGDVVLDIGTGSGLQAVEAAKKAKSVLAVDINKDAISFCKKKIKDKKITFKISDLFADVKGRYDLMIFNPPYLPRDDSEPEDMAVALAGGRHGYEILERFLAEASDHLTDKGRIMILFSDRTNKAKVEQFIADNLFDFDEVASKNIFFEMLHVYLITKSKFRLVLESKKIENIKKLTHGHRGLIYTGVLNGKKVAIKLQRSDIGAKETVNNEITKLKFLNKKDIGPELLLSGKDYFVYKFVEGDFIIDAFEANTKKSIIKIIKNTLDQCFTLDKLGLNKEEMHHPLKHVLVGKDQKVTLLDFERCKYIEKPHNVTQFCQFISSGYVKLIFDKKNMSLSKESVMKAAQQYRKAPSKKSFDAIIRLVEQA